MVSGDALGYGGDYMMSVQVMSYGGSIQTLASFDNLSKQFLWSKFIEEGYSLQKFNNSYSFLSPNDDMTIHYPILNPPYMPLNRDNLVEYRVMKLILMVMRHGSFQLDWILL